MSPDTSILEHELRRQIATLTAELETWKGYHANLMKSDREVHIAQQEEITELTAERDQLQCDYQRIISEVLACNPQPASSRTDDQLEPPWEVIARVRAERDRAVEALRWYVNAENRATLYDETIDLSVLSRMAHEVLADQPLDSEAKPE